MADRPRDITDLYLAPVLLAVDARIDELGRMDEKALVYEVALDSDIPDITRSMREEGLIKTITHLIDTHHWTFSWDPRGLRLTNGHHTFVLGVPAVLRAYLDDKPGRLSGRGPAGNARGPRPQREPGAAAGPGPPGPAAREWKASRASPGVAKQSPGSSIRVMP